MSRPESVSSSTHSVGSSIAICRISVRFFSPPEKPTFTGRFSISDVDFQAAGASRTSFMNSGVVSSLLAALACARR